MTRSSRVALAAAVAVCAALFALPASALAFGPLSSFGSEGEGAGQISNTGSIAIAADGSSYVADYSNNRISVFSPTGGFLFAFGKGVNLAGGDVCTAASGCKIGVPDGSAGSMYEPESIAFDSAGNVYVADAGYNRVDVFTAAGAFLYAFGKDVELGPGTGNVCTASGCEGGLGDGSAGAMTGPTGIGIDGANLYVADREENRIDVFTTRGAFLYAFGEEVNPSDSSNICTMATECQGGTGDGDAGAMDEPYDVKPGPNGLLAISDEENHRIDVFSTGGAFVRAFGLEVNSSDDSNVCTGVSGCQEGGGGGGAGAFEEPTALAVDGAGSIYVADAFANRIEQVSFEGAFVRAFGEGVVDGAAAFQICTTASGCQEGGVGEAGSIVGPYGVALDCRGAVYATEETLNFARVQRFGEPGTAAPPCPAPTPAPAAVPIAAAAKPSNKIKFGKLTLNKKKGTATLVVKVPGPGRLVLKGKGLKKVKRAAKKASSVKLPVVLAGKAKKKLNKAGKAKVKAKLTFSPTGGTPLTTPKSLTLKKTLGG